VHDGSSDCVRSRDLPRTESKQRRAQRLHRVQWQRMCAIVAGIERQRAQVGLQKRTTTTTTTKQQQQQHNNNNNNNKARKANTTA
jgi:hypothetical protein